MATRMQQRRGTATQWTTADPILAPGEIGFESDTNQFKIGDGINHWSDLSYFKNLEDLGGSLDDYVLLSTKGQAGGVASLDENGVIPSEQIPLIVGLDTEITTAVNNAITSLVDGAPTALNTLNELAAAVNDNENFAATVVSALDLKAPLASPTFTGTVSGVTKSHVGLGSVDNTTDLNKPISTAMQTALDLKAPIASPTFTGTVSGITKSMVGLENVNNTADSDKPVSTATQSALDLKQDRITGVTDTEIGYLDGVTSAIQTQLNSLSSADSTHDAKTTTVHGIADTSLLATKSYADSAVSTHDADTTNVHGIVDTAALATKTYSDGAVSTAVAALTKSSVGLGNVDNTSDANKPISNATQSALDGKAPLASPTFTGTVAGITKSMVGLANVDNTSDADKPVSSATQTALDAKLASATAASTYAPLASPTFTGTVSGVTKSHVGLANVDNTSDASKPVSTATQTALDAKAPLASPALTGTPTAPLAATGTNTEQLATTSFVQQEISILTTGAPGLLNTLDELAAALGDDANYAATVTTALTAKAPLAGPTFTGTVTLPSTTSIGNVSSTEIGYIDGVTSAIQTQLNAKTPELYTFVATTGTTKTIATADAFKSLKFTDAGAITVTIPTHASDAIPVGTYVELYQWGGQITVVAATPATTSIRSTDSQTKSRTTYSAMVLVKVADNEWLLTGDLTA